MTSWKDQQRQVRIAVGTQAIEGDLSLPADPCAIVVFAHGSGSSRHSPRNRQVAQLLHQGGLATLLIDLLTPHEEREDLRTGHLRFDIDLLSERLVSATDWLAHQSQTRDLKVGYFGASTGGGAALVAAIQRPAIIGAVVCCGSRPDLAGPSLSRVRAPTLLIVGENDTPVIQLNREALLQIQTEKKLEIIPGATHLFQEPGALEKVARLARQWFERHLISVPSQLTIPRSLQF